MIVYQSDLGEYQNNIPVVDNVAYLSSWYGCPMPCKGCQSAQLPNTHPLTYEEIIQQIQAVPHISKFAFYQHGEPFLNIENVKSAVDAYPNYSFVISTIGLPNQDYSWIRYPNQLEFNLFYRPSNTLTLLEIRNISHPDPIIIKCAEITEELLNLFNNDHYIIKVAKRR